MGVFTTTIAGASDSIADRCRSEIEEPEAGGKVFFGATRDAQGMPPLVPRRSREKLRGRAPAQPGERRMPSIENDDPQTGNPNGYRRVRLETRLLGESKMAGGSKQFVNR